MRASDLENNSVVDIDGEPFVVENLVVQSPSARGSSTLYKVRFRNLRSGSKLDKVFKGDDMIKDADYDRRETAYSYKDGDRCVFTDVANFEEFTLQVTSLQEQLPYMSEGQEGLFALYFNGKAVAIELPPVVDMEVVECDPSIRGASATARTKPAKLPSGLVVQVPEYLERGEVIRVDTRSGKFVSRA